MPLHAHFGGGGGGGLGGSPCRKIQLLVIAHPVMGITISGTRGIMGDEAHPGPQF